MPTSAPGVREQTAVDVAVMVARAREGDSEAFGEVCLALEVRLLRQATLLCGEPSLAEDLTQETLVEAWRCLARYNGNCQFFTWLCAILHNRYRAFVRRKRLLSLLYFRSAGSRGPRDYEAQPDDVARPDQTTQSREQAALLRRCINALPTKQQQVIYLRFFVDHSLEGVATALGCSVGTVKSRLFHALEKLRRMPALNESAEKASPRCPL